MKLAAKAPVLCRRFIQPVLAEQPCSIQAVIRPFFEGKRLEPLLKQRVTVGMLRKVKTGEGRNHESHCDQHAFPSHHTHTMQHQEFDHWGSGIMTSDRLLSAIRMDSPARSNGWVGATLVPTSYEPNYKYPLIVGLHGRGGDELQAAKWVQRISDRNYLGFCPRGLVQLPRRGQFAWGNPAEQSPTAASDWKSLSTAEKFNQLVQSEISDPIAAGEFAVLDQIRRMQDELSVHPDRVFLFGVGEGASMAYRLALSFPDRFAGVISIQGWLPTDLRYLSRYHESRRLKFLVLHGAWDESLPIEETKRQVNEMKGAGLNVAFQTYPSDGKPVGPMFDTVNTWLMRQIHSSIG